jgi:hypothetical protein
VKKRLLLVCVLLALSGLMAAMAYSYAEVTNAGSIKIVSTNNALVAIAHAGSDQDKIVQIEEGEAVFKFGRGFGGEMWGFQPNSVYKYDAFMHVKNNSNNPVRVWLELKDFDGAEEYITITHLGTKVIDKGKWTGAKIEIGLEGWRTRNFGLTIDVPSGAPRTQFNGTIIVHSEIVR